VAFSLPPYSNETIDAVKFAKEKGIRTIAISNKPSSPVTFYSETQLIVQSKNMLFTNSFASISVLINAIATECALRNKSKANRMLKELNEVVKKQKLVSTDQAQ
jgi:DNA-binding MurR/RpiR family transcriptional regulator